MHTSDELTRFADFQPTGFDVKGLGSDDQADWLVCPLIHQPKIAGLLETSNWETAVAEFERLQRRYDKARRRILHKLNRRNGETPFLGVSIREFAKEMCERSADLYETGFGFEAERRLLESAGLPPVEGETIAAFAERLEQALEAGADYETHYFGHWATDFEIIVVRPGSWAHREAQKLAAALSDYPVLDESDYSRREYESQCEAISDALRSLTIEDDGVDVGDWDLFHQAVFEDLWDCDQQSLECSDEGCWLSRETIEASLERLGFVYCENEMVWRPEGETESVCPEEWRLRPGGVSCRLRLKAEQDQPIK